MISVKDWQHLNSSVKQSVTEENGSFDFSKSEKLQFFNSFKISYNFKEWQFSHNFNKQQTVESADE